MRRGKKKLHDEEVEEETGKRGNGRVSGRGEFYPSI